mgnify:CR=1 FL=1
MGWFSPIWNELSMVSPANSSRIYATPISFIGNSRQWNLELRFLVLVKLSESQLVVVPHWSVSSVWTENWVFHRRKNEAIYLVYFPVSRAGSLSDSDRAWIPKPAFESSNKLVQQCRSLLHCLSPQHLPILAGDDDPHLSQTEFSSHSTLVGDWSEHCFDDLGCSESELDDGSHFTSVFAAISCLRGCL